MNTRQKKALNYLTQNGTITNREFRELFGVSHKTAHIELTNLVGKGILTIQGAGRSTSYIFPSHLKNTANGVINGLFEKQ
jgi:ATP-dependent DNA helicase RecG